MKVRIMMLLAAVAAPILVCLGGCSSYGGYDYNQSSAVYYPDRYQRDYYYHRPHYQRPVYQRPVYVAPDARSQAVIVAPDGRTRVVYDRY